MEQVRDRLLKSLTGAMAEFKLRDALAAGANNNIAIVGIEFYAYTRDPSSPSYNPNAADTNGTDFLNPAQLSAY